MERVAVTQAGRGRLALVLAVGAAALASGCAHDYMYLPVGGNAEGGPAASYPVPPNAPQGAVYVTSFGFTDLEVPQGRSGPLLHARLAVSNGGQAPWTVDVLQQRLVVLGQPPEPPAYVNTQSGNGPVYQVGAGQAGVFDLYYRVPPGLDQAARLYSFTLDWNVNVNGQVVAESTPFQREEEGPASYDTYPPYVAVGLGWGLGWWGSPYFAHEPPLVRGYYYPPARIRGGAWRGPRPGGWGGGSFRAPPAGGFHGGGVHGATGGHHR
jgi:hypothetical protein